MAEAEAAAEAWGGDEAAPALADEGGTDEACEGGEAEEDLVHEIVTDGSDGGGRWFMLRRRQRREGGRKGCRRLGRGQSHRLWRRVLVLERESSGEGEKEKRRKRH